MDRLGTCVSTPSKPTVPQSASEVVLYCVLEKANLTQYFSDFIAQGGDDVQQLCEAGEDEFLEIMALVGMASKPLHVRRLQKALQEWALFPEKFKIPLKKITSNQTYEVENGRSVQGHSLLRNLITQPPPEPFHQSFQPQNKSCSPTSDASDHETNNSQMDLMLQSNDNKLSDLQVEAIERAASDRAKHLPLYAPKPLNVKKPLDREIEEAMSLPMDDDTRLELFRKYGAIYGRFDSKRSKNKQLNFHEMCVNEAAAQLCLHRPSLITRREDLFFQARQVVKEAGLQLTRVQYSGDFRSKDYPLNQTGDNDCVTPSKVPKISYSPDPSINATSQMNGFSSPLNSLGLFQTPLSWGKSCSFNDHFPSPSSLLLPGREDSDDLKLTLKGDGELSLLEEGLKIARQYGMSALDEDSNKVEKVLKRQLHT